MRLTRLRATLWRLRYLLAALTVLAMLSAVVSAISEVKTPMAQVVVSSRELSAGSKLGGSDLALVEVPRDLVPHGVLTQTDAATDRILTTSLPAGMPLSSTMLLSSDFLASAPPGRVIVSVTITADGTEELAQPGASVALYAPPDDYADTGEAVLVTDKATVVGVGLTESSGGFLSEESNTRILYVSVPQNAASLVLGYGARTTMQVVLLDPA
ncbi:MULTISPECIES: SAF domain-containing protein [unclassified Actinobaculum]|uniref:SAF domain-containing protein n=1 Tax=unclassified Actinobaculum TaxID=2609299 RepID=UPI000D52686F|nr:MULTISPECIES: SAF domain-containing protein [unclassified Actinobaculum]AWE41684.1 hypothetical protein DDD63_01680 [Actinobaculum sp. 313]RTE49303.1 hypothetical protein EKN07_06980 [Actinobaculum sp. 352]